MSIKEEAWQWKACLNKIFLIILIGFYTFLIVHFKPWTDIAGNNDILDILLAFAVLITLIGLIISCLGLLFNKRTNLACIIFNGAYLSIGCFATYIYWSLWIFHTPTLKERFVHTVPAFILGICLPVMLFYYFAKVKHK